MERETSGKLDISKVIKVTIRVSTIVLYLLLKFCFTFLDTPKGFSGAFEPWISEWASGLRLTCAGEAKLYVAFPISFSFCP